MVPLFQAVQILDPFGLHTCQTADTALMRFGHARFALLYWLRCNEHHLTNLATRTSTAAGQTTEAPGGPGPL